MKKTFATAAALALLVCLLNIPASAQQSATANLSGNVIDPNGAVIAGAQVIVTQKGTGAGRETTTDAEGSYALTNLTPGEYEVKVQSKGFSTKVSQTPVVLQVGQSLTLDVTLELDPKSETVIVDIVEEIPLVDTLSSKVDSVVNEREIASLPLNGRNFLELALLVPGNSPAPNFDPTKTNVVAAFERVAENDAVSVCRTPIAAQG